jgi:hypothetical protein
MTLQDLASELRAFVRRRPSASIWWCASTCPISNSSEDCGLRTDRNGRRQRLTPPEFPDLPSMFAIIRGQANAIEEFMHDRFA